MATKNMYTFENDGTFIKKYKTFRGIMNLPIFPPMW